MTFTKDWSHTRVHWPDLFAELEPKRILEIGCFEGQATRWILDRWPEAEITVVDVFTFEGQYKRFRENVPEVRAYAIVGPSSEIVPVLPRDTHDLIYVDGDHSAPGVLSDAVLAFPRLRRGGWMLFDDYNLEEMPGVYQAVDAFVSCYDALLAEAGPVGADQYLVVKA